MPDKEIDRREQVFKYAYTIHTLDNDFVKGIPDDKYMQIGKMAMDQYFTERALELLDYVVKNTTGHAIDEEGNVEFKYKGEWISAKQLFENFL